MIEMLVVVAICGMLAAIALPNIQKSWQSYHLSSATSTLTGAIQATRYQAIFNGCSYQLVISGNTYQVQAQLASGSPSACATTYTNVVSGPGQVQCTSCAVQFSSGDVDVSTATTLIFSPNGTVSVTGSTAPFNIVLSFNVPGQTASRTIKISGVGYVTTQ